MNQDDEKKKEAVNVFPDHLGRLLDIKKIKPAKSSNNGWISVDDKLPPNNTPVLIYLDDDVVVCELGLQNNITIACYDNGLGDDLPCWLSIESQNCSSVVMPVIINPSEVAYWQPLPEPPVE